MIGIIDYGMGNLYSVTKALERLNIDPILSDDPEELEACRGLILPGVGAFPDAIRALEDTKLDQFIKRKSSEGVPILGICLGMQLLFEESEENGVTKGLSLLPGRVIRFQGKDYTGKKFKIPHMGWNNLDQHQPDSLLMRKVSNGFVYFVHSYYLQTTDPSVVIASAQYETEVPAVVGKGNVYGTQFHPEKSGETGMTILQNFCTYIEQFDQQKGVIK